ncbi:hypothetical protein ACRALDRAFT_1073131 [Sodiomyces alcalophilus JCM 7366]|uniref:uncharacterized protein n=1 Tax=Sodiomyces alcalophilus JCM 7366 TaxID=591952 RepID=UPI0039B692EE
MRLYRAFGPLLLLATHTAGQSLDREIEEILSRPTFADATVGIKVRDLDTDEIIYTLNEDVPLTPASNQKLVTATVALANLGPDFVYNTTVVATSAIDADGTLDGDLWLVGSGDPSLSSARLADMAKEVVEQMGLRKITGRVYGDGTVFDRELLGEGVSPDDQAFYYAAQVAGLNCDLNVVNITVGPGNAVGDPAQVTVNGLEPEDEAYVEVDSSVNTVEASTGQGVSFDRLSGTNTIVVVGSLSLGINPPAYLTVTIHDPTAYAAYRFALALQGQGVEVSSTPTEPKKAPAHATQLGSSTSEPLSDLLKHFLKNTDNMYGEALLKTLGVAANPDTPGSSVRGVGAVRAFLRGEAIDTTGVETADGSGLSHSNDLTARFLDHLLVYNRRSISEVDWSVFFDALPVGGVDGTLSERFVDSPLEGKVRAKTGTLTGASGLSGYLSGHGGREYVFSILMNGFTDGFGARQAQDDMVRALHKV